MAFWRIVENDSIAENMMRLTMEAEADFPVYQPGQFLHIRVTDGLDHLLRRPISLCLAEPDKKRLIIVYRVSGKGTKLLAAKQAGEQIDVLGPLGKGFPIYPTDRNAVLVAGGIGVPPMLELAKQLTEAGKHVTSIVGFQSKQQVILTEELAGYGQVLTVTNDGSHGQLGLVTDCMTEDLLQKTDRVYACGPAPMLAAVQKVMQGKAEGFLSLEERMGCGIGLCAGCVHKTIMPDGSIGYRKVCKEGPVFPAQEVIFYG